MNIETLGIWVAIVTSVVSCIYAALGYHTRSQNLSRAEARAEATKPPFTRRQLLIGASFPVIAWLAVFTDMADRHFSKQKAPTPWENELLDSYGIENNIASVTVHGERMQQYAHDYKVLLIVRTRFANVDEMTDPVIAKSIAYTITKYPFVVSIPNPRIRVKIPAINPIGFFLTVIPTDVSPDEITKLADIEHVGGKILDARGIDLPFGNAKQPPPPQQPL